MPVDWSKYPKCWRVIRSLILERAGHCCEGSPAYPDCRVPNYQPHPVTGSKVVLTIAHLDHDTKNNTWHNLRALCQRCHNTHDAKVRAAKRCITMDRKKHPLLYVTPEKRKRKRRT